MSDQPKQVEDAGHTKTDTRRTGFKDSELRLPYLQWMELLSKSAGRMSVFVADWVSAWNTLDLALSPMPDHQRAITRLGHWHGYCQGYHADRPPQPKGMTGETTVCVTRMSADPDFKIQSGVAIPKPALGNPKYPLGEIQPGDSFFVPFDGTEPWRKFSDRVRAAVSVYNIRHKDKKFAARRVDDRSGIRVWRKQ